MKTEKEIWIEEVFNGAEKIQPVEAGVYLFGGVQSRLHNKIRQIEIVPLQTVSLVAASIALLFALNFAVLTYSTHQKQTSVHTSVLIENSFDIYSNS